jgi:nucleoside 2-deoxyribosyltransferase
MPNSRTCFVIMPFKPELNYFYLYIRDYLKDKHAITCERGDHKVLTIPLLEKVRNHILEADVLVADISGRNPNVFYELGLADAYGKKVILITQDSAAEVPTDIKHLEFIKYDLSQHVEFLSKLDNAMHHVFVDRYVALYEKAITILQQFNSQAGLHCEEASAEEFQSRVVLAERTQGIPSDSPGHLTGFLLPKIIKENSDINIIQKISDWVSQISP